MEINNTDAMALATHALLVKLIVVMRKSGALSDDQLLTAIRSARRVLEEDADPTGVQAGLLLESLQDSVLGA